MKRSSLILLITVASSTAGCAEDVGTCDDSNRGRDTVLVDGTTVEYAGQAIINKACATGCHSSSAEGEDRHGAPAGLDFDLRPVSEDDANGEGKNSKGEAIVKLTRAQIAGLRERQSRVFDLRNEIWQQVTAGLMPPSGKFAGWRELKSIFSSKESTPCTKAKKSPFADITQESSQEALRNWLACGAPLVETNGSTLEKSVRGSAGYQYPICEAETSETGGVITLESLVEGPFANCGACHPLLGPPDLSTLDKFAAAIDSSEEMCLGKPFITRGDPEQSFLYDLLTQDSPGCGNIRMPYNGDPLTKAQLKNVSDWITAGAPITADDVGEVHPDDSDDASDDADPDAPSDDDDDQDQEDQDAGLADAGRDAGRSDAGRDAGGTDAGRDAGKDAGRDAGRDGRRDAGR